MKTIRLINTIAVAIPFAIAACFFIEKSCIFYALYSLIITGFLQLIAAVLFMIKNPKSGHIKVYFTITSVFFLSWIFYPTYILIFIPPCLCLYLSVIIYSRENETI